MRLTFFLLALFAIAISGPAQASHAKHRSAHPTSKPKSDAKARQIDKLFSGERTLDGRVAVYNLTLGVARASASEWKMDLEVEDTDAQNAQQARDAGGEGAETKVQDYELKVAEEKVTTEKARFDTLKNLNDCQTMIRILAKDARLKRRYHFGPKYHFEDAYSSGLAQNVRERIITSPLVANPDVVLPGSDSP